MLSCWNHWMNEWIDVNAVTYVVNIIKKTGRRGKKITRALETSFVHLVSSPQIGFAPTLPCWVMDWWGLLRCSLCPRAFFMTNCWENLTNCCNCLLHGEFAVLGKPTLRFDTRDSTVHHYAACAQGGWTIVALHECLNRFMFADPLLELDSLTLY